MTRRSCLSRMIPTRFCGLSSDVGGALIAETLRIYLYKLRCAPHFRDLIATQDWFYDRHAS
ncbi:hypothetical protein BLNAU_4981 [Blattamonas nauphoetae]|uniref:Uncharacterized protein n=1 Tax=Blattamonas nauphoetae TaxID=2049346 RepID=A0ABQ9Y8T0_9EUKA|nr:hypothetical protein BLNAU_4981 [Blattamonas nauphoetae]